MSELTTFLLQIVVILIAARLIGGVFRLIHQPQVIGEMAAGILLGPSLLGWLAPGVAVALFSPASLDQLAVVSQMGLILFMFLVGLELHPQVLRTQARLAASISLVSIAVPFALGLLSAVWLYASLAPPGVPWLHFALFLGTAMSVTAFPVLARILTERKLQQTSVGTIALAAAAFDDVAAWSMLAGVVFLVRASDLSAPPWATLLGAVVYTGLMVFAGRPLLARLFPARPAQDGISQDRLALALILVFISAWITEQLGIHALFGAFLLGAILPKDPALVRPLTQRVVDLTVVLLLPIFFALTGLRTQIGLISGREMWLYGGVIMAVAVAGKLGGALAVARASGMSLRDAAAVGVLMNTRGLVELVVLNIGFDIGVISPALFTLMVLMALLTTFMAPPLLAWLYVGGRRPLSTAITGE